MNPVYPKANSPKRFGLLDVAEVVYTSDPHMNMGITIVSPPCAQPDCIESSLCPGGPEKVIESDYSQVEISPCVAYVGHSCSSVGHASDTDWFAKTASEALEANLSCSIEKALSAGCGTNPHFYDGNAVVLGSAAASPVAGIALAEQHACDCAMADPVIHVPRAVLPFLCRDSQVIERDGQFQTCAGTPVVVGCGYEGNDPAGAPAAPGEAWIYVTSKPVVYLSQLSVIPETFAEALDPSTNDVSFVAERWFSVGYSDCCEVGAIQISLC